MGSLNDHLGDFLPGEGSIHDQLLSWLSSGGGVSEADLTAHEATPHGSDLGITDEGVSVADGVTEIDFVGNVQATNSGGGVVTVTVPPDPGHPDVATHEALGLATDADLAAAVASITHNNQTASYVLVIGDAGKVVEMEVAGANTLTVPPNGTVAFPVGTVIGFRQYGAGQVTLTPGVGVTIRSRIGLKTAGQYSEGTLTKRATNEWVASGDLAA